MAYSDRGFIARFSEMGDQAEQAFTTWAAQENINLVAYGLNRPPFRSFHVLPLFIRMTPDFLCEGKKKFFVECKGTGGRVIKIKPDSITALKQWHEHLPVYVFVYNSSDNTAAFVSLLQLDEACQQSPIKQFKSDQKEYYEIKNTHFEWFSLTKGTQGEQQMTEKLETALGYERIQQGDYIVERPIEESKGDEPKENQKETSEQKKPKDDTLKTVVTPTNEYTATIPAEENEFVG